MKYCINCGAEISDNAKFCGSCGTEVYSTEKLETIKAPDTEGEYELASWSESAPRQSAKKRQAASGKKAASKKVKPQKKGQKKGLFSYIWLFAKVLFIAVGAVFLLVLGMELAKSCEDDSYSPYPQDPDKPGVFKPQDYGFHTTDELTPQQRVVYLESLLERSEAQLERELAKGDEADMKEVTELREGIAKIHKTLEELKSKIKEE